ncbi:hypothetical protein [Actinomadura litoris]|uniref:hypothetical protein n=1 Tax=Actinomadura litoris TaxID=2678616 RepID=UPI001FA714AE|nr:hypothetical protein [Actinomadura litoris]
MPHPDNAGGQAARIADPVINELAGTGPRPAALPAPGCPLRAASLASLASGEARDEASGDRE